MMKFLIVEKLPTKIFLQEISCTRGNGNLKHHKTYHIYREGREKTSGVVGIIIK